MVHRGRRAAVVLALAALLCVAATAAGCGGGSGGPEATMQPLGNVTTLDVQQQVFTPRCALSGCHVGTGAPFGLDLSSVSSSSANLVGVASAEMPSLSRIEPYDPDASYLFMKVTDDPAIQGDRMPQIGSPLNAADLALIQAWIDQGAM